MNVFHNAAPYVRRLLMLSAIQVVVSLVSTYLISKISFIGKAGIFLFYREYRILRSGWKTFLLLLGIQLLVVIVLEVISRRYDRRILRYWASGLLVLAVVGLLATYNDFQNTFSHRLLKERFHLGFYLFWLGWGFTCVYYFLAVRPPIPDRGEFPPQ